MDNFSKSLLSEIKYYKDIWEDDGGCIESYFSTNHGIILFLMEDMDIKESLGNEYKYELQNYAVKIGIYKPHTKKQIDDKMVFTTNGKRRKKYDFKRKDKYYVFESWQPINDIIDKERKLLKGSK